MITHEEVRHNAAALRPRAIRGFVPVLLALTLAACSGETGKTEDPAPSAETREADCPLVMDTSGWTEFKILADRVEAGENVPKEDFFTYSELPAVTLWNKSLDRRSPSADRVANWVEGLFWEKLGRGGEQKRHPDRSMYLHSANYSLQNREMIDTRVDNLTGPRRCEMDSLIRYWVEPENLPPALTVHFLPGRAEIRILEGDLFVDTGVLGAGSEDQVIRNVASLLFRTYQAIPGPNPMEVEGELSLAQSFRVLASEGVVGWIDKGALLEFSDDHPSLYKVNIVPEDFFFKAQEAIGLMNRQLGKMLDDEADLAARGRFFAEHLAAMNAFSQTGYGMSAVISARLGEDRLRQASRTVPGFLAAYQEAALQNPVPAPQPGKQGHELHETVPPLDPEIFTKLHALLTRVFPE